MRDYQTVHPPGLAAHAGTEIVRHAQSLHAPMFSPPYDLSMSSQGAMKTEIAAIEDEIALISFHWRSAPLDGQPIAKL